MNTSPTGSKILMCLIIIVNILSAQGPQNSDEVEIYKPTYKESLLSPNASSFNNYVSFPSVSGNTGKIGISVPIYTFSDQDNEVDISLNYDPNRSKVDQLSTWVGTGWVLNCGGIISREVRGKPDDVGYVSKDDFSYLQYNNPYPFGIFPTHWLSKEKPFGKSETSLIENFPTNFIQYDLTQTNHSNALGKAIAFELNQWQYDLEPDIYTVNINGNSFKFVFTEDGDPKFLNDLKNYKIEYFQTNNGIAQYGTNSTIIEANEFHTGPWSIIYWDTHIYKFKITDSKGYQYYFEEDGIEYTTPYIRSIKYDARVNVGKIIQHEQELPPHPTAWYMSRIVSPTGAEVSFSYSTVEYTDIFPVPFYAGACEGGGNCSSNDNNRFRYSFFHNLPEFVINNTINGYEKWMNHSTGASKVLSGFPVSEILDIRPRYKLGVKYLSSITADNYEIEFRSNNSRQDMLGHPELNEIIISEVNSNYVVKKFQLFYQYSKDLGAPAGIQIHEAKRLYLDYVNEVGVASGSKLIVDLEYSSDVIPYRFSPEEGCLGILQWEWFQ